jgi:hypothetical protein
MQELYAVSDYKLNGQGGLTVFLDKSLAIEYRDMDNKKFCYRYQLLKSDGLDDNGGIKWSRVEEGE